MLVLMKFLLYKSDVKVSSGEHAHICYLHRIYYCYLQSTYGLAPFRVKNEFVIGKSCISRRCGGTRGGGTFPPPPDFGRPVLPIPTRGPDYGHITVSPLDF